MTGRVTRIMESQKRVSRGRWIGAILTALLAGSVAVPTYAQGEVVKRGADVGLGALAILILLVLMIAAFAGFTLLWRGIFPRRLDWTGEIARRMPWGSFFCGLVASIVILIIVAILGKAGDPGGLLALIVLSAFLILFGSFGKAAVIEWAGEMVDPSATGIRRALLGAGSLWLLLLIPIVGWLVLAAFGLTGIGAGIVSYVPTRQVPAQSKPGDSVAEQPQEHSGTAG